MRYQPGDTYEPRRCDECGSIIKYRLCQRCEAEYRQGKADVDAYHDALAIGGEELAVRMEMEAEYGYLG